MGRDWAVLLAVGEGEPPSRQAMARGLGINRQTMVELVDGLETKGLVRRRPHPADRRVNAVELTAAGRKVLRQATTAGDAAAATFLAGPDRLDVGGFVFTREPYDPDADVPGGVDAGGWRPMPDPDGPIIR